MDVKKISKRIRDRATELGMKYDDFLAEVVRQKVNPDTAMRWWFGYYKNPPIRRVREIMASVLKTNEDELFN